MGRNATIEWLRVLAMFEIVAFHADVSRRLPLIGGLGLPVFLLLTGAFAVLGAERRGARSVIEGKVQHLGTWWIAWCAVYAIERGLMLDEPFELSMLLYGPSVHLWFVPFSIFACVVCASLYDFTRVPARASVPALIVLVAAAAAPLPEFPDGTPFEQWRFALPAIPLGLALGLAALSRSTSVLVATVGAGAALCLHSPRYGIALAVVAIAFALPTRGGKLISTIAPCMLGVYYVHAGALDVLHGRIDYGVLIVVAFAASLAIALIARSTPFAPMFSSNRVRYRREDCARSSTPDGA